MPHLVIEIAGTEDRISTVALSRHTGVKYFFRLTKSLFVKLWFNLMRGTNPSSHPRIIAISWVTWPRQKEKTTDCSFETIYVKSNPFGSCSFFRTVAPWNPHGYSGPEGRIKGTSRMTKAVANPKLATADSHVFNFASGFCKVSMPAAANAKNGFSDSSQPHSAEESARKSGVVTDDLWDLLQWNLANSKNLGCKILSVHQRDPWGFVDWIVRRLSENMALRTDSKTPSSIDQIRASLKLNGA